jgi:methionine sulfoxide reductase catalytic subunit
MAFFHPRPSWQLPETRVTAEGAFWQRRRFMKSLIGAGVGFGVATLGSCQRSPRAIGADLERTLGEPLSGAALNPAFANAGREPTAQIYASSYNNYYEFGGSKNIWQSAQALPTDPWRVEVGGLVKKPTTFDLDDLTQRFDLEERIYRFRCVEAWAMVVPWIGFPMQAMMAVVEPTSAAKFVRFTSFYDPQVCPGPGLNLRELPWPYTEGLTVAEMANDLAFFAVGVYGRTLPKQQGAPLRMVLPWKYGFKGAKAIVKVEFVAEQPATYWNTLAPREYGFEANVEPQVPHPRWSQAKERLVGEPTALFTWEEQPTVIYNGYGEWVGGLYG